VTTTAGWTPRLPLASLLAGAAGLAFVTLAATIRFGPKALALPVAVVAGVLLVRSAATALGLLLGVALVAETDPDGFTPTSALYGPFLPGLKPFDALFLAVAVIVLLDVVRRRSAPRLPWTFVVPLLILVAAMAAGAVTGRFAGVGLQPIFATVLVIGYLLAMPLMVAAVVRTPEHVLRMLGAVGAVVVLKALAGIVALVIEIAPIEVDGNRITYYEPTTNWLIVVMLAVIAAGALRRAALPAWMTWLWPLLLAALILSYRRAFWVGAVIALIAVLAFGVSRLQRRFVVPLALVAAGGVALALSTGLGAGVQGPVVDRAESLSPSQISANASDRYRITERVNVVEEVRRHPVTGLGIGMPWRARFPIATGGAGARQYTHVAVLWYWLKLGILGPVAYLGLILAGAYGGLRVFRRHPDRRLAVFGLGSSAALLGFLVAELTASFTGVEDRFTVVMGAHLGVLAVLQTQLPVDSGRGRRRARHLLHDGP